MLAARDGSGGDTDGGALARHRWRSRNARSGQARRLRRAVRGSAVEASATCATSSRSTRAAGPSEPTRRDGRFAGREASPSPVGGRRSFRRHGRPVSDLARKMVGPPDRLGPRVDRAGCARARRASLSRRRLLVRAADALPAGGVSARVRVGFRRPRRRRDRHRGRDAGRSLHRARRCHGAAGGEAVDGARDSRRSSSCPTPAEPFSGWAIGSGRPLPSRSSPLRIASRGSVARPRLALVAARSVCRARRVVPDRVGCGGIHGRSAGGCAAAAPAQRVCRRSGSSPDWGLPPSSASASGPSFSRRGPMPSCVTATCS